MLVLLQRFRHRYLFQPPFEFRCGEPVGEGERSRPFPLPFLFGSCLNAHASPYDPWPLLYPTDAVSSLGSVFLHFICLFLLLFPLVGGPIAGLSSSRFLALTWESLIFCSRCLWAINFNLAIITLLVADCRLLSVDLQQVFQFFRLVNSYLVQTLQYAVSRSVCDCWSHFIPLRVEVLNVVVL